jgi:hypothetical protein
LNSTSTDEDTCLRVGSGSMKAADSMDGALAAADAG